MRKHRGAITIVLAAFLVTTVTSLVVLALAISAHDAYNAKALQEDGVKALFLAESGIERALRRFATQNCLDLAPDGPFSLGEGTFAITDAFTTDFQGNPLPADRCRIRSQGHIPPLPYRYLEAILSKGGAFIEHFDYPNYGQFNSQWPQTLIWNHQGRSTLDLSQTAPSSPGGSMMAYITRWQPGWRYVYGYREHTLDTPIPAGTDLTYGIWYKKQLDGALWLSMNLTLVSDTGTEHILWYNGTVADIPWTEATGTFTTTDTIDRVRLYFSILERSFGWHISQNRLWFDALRLVGGQTDITDWREVSP